MALIKAKQLDISTVAASLTTYFTNDTTSRDDFVNSIKDATGFDEKVKTSNTDPTSGFLVDKITGDTDPGNDININVTEINDQLVISGDIDISNIITLLLAAFTVIQIEASIPIPVYQDNNLIDKKIIFVTREGLMMFEGVSQDEYSFNSTTGEISFVSQVEIGERLRIFYI